MMLTYKLIILTIVKDKIVTIFKFFFQKTNEIIANIV